LDLLLCLLLFYFISSGAAGRISILVRHRKYFSVSGLAYTKRKGINHTWSSVFSDFLYLSHNFTRYRDEASLYVPSPHFFSKILLLLDDISHGLCVPGQKIQEKTDTARYGTYRDVSFLRQSLFLDITAPSRSSCLSQYEIFSTIFCSLPVARLSPYVFIDTFKLELLPYKFELLCPIFSSWQTVYR